MFLVGATGTAEAGAARPPGAADSSPSRIIHHELWNARPRTRRLGFPWNSKAERVSRSRRCMNGIGCSRRHPQESEASQRPLPRPLAISAGCHMLPAKPREAEARTDSASTGVHTTVDSHSPMEERSPQRCAQRWTSSAQHSGLHRWHGSTPRYGGDARLRGKWTTRASTPPAPTGDDTLNAHGRSAYAVTPLSLKRGPFQ